MMHLHSGEKGAYAVPGAVTIIEIMLHRVAQAEPSQKWRPHAFALDRDRGACRWWSFAAWLLWLRTAAYLGAGWRGTSTLWLRAEIYRFLLVPALTSFHERFTINIEMAPKGAGVATQIISFRL